MRGYCDKEGCPVPAGVHCLCCDGHYCAEHAKHVSPPVHMLLWCPNCHTRHVDSEAFAAKPHHTHACQHCGMVWRPAIVHTVGVQFLPGFKNG